MGFEFSFIPALTEGDIHSARDFLRNRSLQKDARLILYHGIEEAPRAKDH